MMLEGKGLEVIDLGTDVAPKPCPDRREQGCQIVACSALLTTTMGVMADVVKAVEEAGIRDQVKIMVGGAPVTEAFAKQIGADAYSRTPPPPPGGCEPLRLTAPNTQDCKGP